MFLTTRDQVQPARARLAPQRVVSVHVPKAAGSSLHAQLVNLLGEDRVVLDLTHDPVSGSPAGAAAFPAGASVVHGHFPARRYAGNAACWITFLRHPVDNVFSNFAYWRKVNGPSLKLDLSEFPSVIDFARYPGQDKLFSELYFGGFDMRRFDFIGFHETRAADMPRLGALLGLPLRSDIQVNKTPVCEIRAAEEADPAIRAQLTDILAPDIKFYEYWRARAPG
jgi:hypothetical protein